MNEYKNKEQITFKGLQSHLMQIYLTINLKVENVLEIGKGHGFVSSILSQYCNLDTLDITKEYNPDLFIDITNLKQLDNTLPDEFYDLILICEVLEHIPYGNIDGILQILKKKTKKYLIISVPNQCAYFNLILFYHGMNKLGFNTLKKIIHIFSTKIGNIFSKLYYRFRNKNKKFIFQGYYTKDYAHHYWELGIDKYSVKIFKNLLNKYFKIIKEGRLRENPWHHFFILKKEKEEKYEIN
ncbi:hypothetical protein LCGC14_1038600 [marine sediment metagenome]|uniref:Methyltransferase type 11 domain-containing protein n=1 Tax=marine sediment metagenome TaxID=412755 RepID=A0A0F9QAQ1_9ZZZZ